MKVDGLKSSVKEKYQKQKVPKVSNCHILVLSFLFALGYLGLLQMSDGHFTREIQRLHSLVSRSLFTLCCSAQEEMLLQVCITLPLHRCCQRLMWFKQVVSFQLGLYSDTASWISTLPPFSPIFSQAEHGTMCLQWLVLS